MLTALTLCVLSTASLAPGDPFSELDYAAALEQAAKEHKLLLVDFTAGGCAPCKKMEQDTWAASEVKAWLTANALAVQVDADAQKELAQRFEIEAMPTVIAVRDGAEFDRLVGYREPKRFLAWGDDVMAGKRQSDGVLERSKALRDSESVRERYEIAGELLQAHQYGEALTHYQWLWPATRDPMSGFAGVRTSYMLSKMAELARKHPPAKAAFDRIFAELQTKIDGAPLPPPMDWAEWTGFCKYFDHLDRVLTWYEKRRNAQGRLYPDADEARARHVVAGVFDALVDKDRLADAARLLADTRRRADTLVASYQRAFAPFEAGEEHPELSEFMARKLREDISKLYAVLLLTEQHGEADTVAAILLKALDDPQSRLALVHAALQKAKKAEPAFAHWLDEAGAAGADVKALRAELDELAAKKD